MYCIFKTSDPLASVSQELVVLWPPHAHSYTENAYMYTAHTYVCHVHTTHEFLRWFHEKKSIKAFRIMLSSYSVLSKGL